MEWIRPGVSFAQVVLFFVGMLYLVLLYGEKTKYIPGAWNPFTIFWILLVAFIVFLVIAWYISPVKLFGVEIISAAPNTCIGQKSSMEGGLCYNNCDPGYHGSAATCYADTVNIGAGTVFGLSNCEDGWKNTGLTCIKNCNDGYDDDGLTCRKPIRGGGNCKTWWDGCASRAPGWLGGGCIGGAKTECDPITGGDVYGKESKGRVAQCPGPQGEEYTEMIAGMCYKPCPPGGWTHVPGLPYLCVRTKEGSNDPIALTYERGVGDIPRLFRLFGKYAFPPFW